MALTEAERLFALYNSPGLTYSVHVYVRADLLGWITGSFAPGATSLNVQTVPAGAAVRDQIVAGDILQVAGEDLLAGNGGSSVINVTRAYAGTTSPAISAPEGTSIAVWKDFTDHVGSDHGIAAVASLARSFEQSLNKYETSASTLKAMNSDRFWDEDTMPLGFASLRGHHVRFYIRTRNDSGVVDNRAIGTMLIDELETDESDIATIKLKGIGSLVRKEAEASNTKQGRAWITYSPTAMVINALLNSVDELRVPGLNQNHGIPLHWRRQLTEKVARTIPLPASTYAISAHGKATDFVSMNGQFTDWLVRHHVKPGNLTDGGYVSAMAWDPQATGVGNVITGDRSTVGRLYFGVCRAIWEFDPVSRESAVAIADATSASNGVNRRIRRLWYNALDTSAAGKPKIHGVAWTDYSDAVPNNNAFSGRVVGGFLFRWNGGSAVANSLDVTNFWPGTHFFRAGNPVGGTHNSIGGAVETDVSWGEAFAAPFSHNIGGGNLDTLTLGLMGGLKQHEGDNDTATPPNEVSYRGDTLTGAEQKVVHPGVVAEAIDADGSALALNKSYIAIKFADYRNTAGGSNFRFTLGNQGACAFYCTQTARNNAADTGAIVYCEMNTTTGIISVNSWEAESGTGVTGIRVGASAAEQFCSMAGCGDQVRNTNQHILFVGAVVWSETGDSEGKIYKYDDLGAETTYYAGAADAVKYYTPLWLAYVPITASINGILTSMYRRDRCGESNQFGYYSGLTSATVTNWANTYDTTSLLHAVTWNKFDTAKAFALDTAGRLVQITLNSTTCAITTVAPQDRGFCPIEGESWSATHQLAPFAANKCYGVSSPAWPFGNDIREGRTDGFYVLWKLDDNLWDTYDLGYFDGQTVEESLADIAFASNAVWAFDYNGRGDFIFEDRVQSTTPRIQIGGDQDRSSFISRRRGYSEIENPVEISPWTLRAGDIRARVDLSSNSRISSSSTPIDVQSPDNKKKIIVMTCIQAGRVGTARFKYYAQTGTQKTYTVETYPAGTATPSLLVAFLGTAPSGPYLETDTTERMRQIQIEDNSRIRLPDGTERSITSFVDGSSGYFQLTLDSSWTPSVNIYAGSAVEIDIKYSRQATDGSAITTGAPNGEDTLLSSFLWQEIGAGTAWATGCLIRFQEPPDDSVDINYNESAWSFGDRIVIECDGLDLVENANSKVSAYDADAGRKYGKKAMTTSRGRLPARKAIYVAEARKTENSVPRWIYKVSTTLLPFMNLFDVITIYSPKMIRTAPYTDTATIRAISHDLNRVRTTIEAIGSQIDPISNET